MPIRDDLSSAAPLVTLRRPLAVVDSAAGAGFVQALAADALVIQFQDVGASPSGSLTIVLDAGRSFQLVGKAHASTTLERSTTPLATTTTALTRIHISDPRQRDILADLLTLIRKSQHIEICATTDIEASDRYTGFSDVLLRPMALPELSWADLDTSRAFLGGRFALPLLITGMTGGLAQGAEINLRLARAAAAAGIPMGVGSQRVALDNPQHAAIFAVKKTVPDLFLIGNIGIAQLRGVQALEMCQRAVEMINADALAIHVNVLQEVVQVEGDRDFRGVLAQIAVLRERLGVPLMIKEVGAGLDLETARRLHEAGVAALDCGGKGGTSWSFIEGERTSAAVTRAVAATFRDWGIPTAVAVALLRRDLPQIPLVATGGIRDGLDVAKAVALGADLCGIGLPLLRAALHSEDAVHEALQVFAQGLKTAMLCSGARTLHDLPRRLHQSRAFTDQLTSYGMHTSGDAVDFPRTPFKRG